MRFVRLLGPIVAIDDLSPSTVILTLDYGSGATVEVKLSRPAPAVPGLLVSSPQPGVTDLACRGRRLAVGTVVKAKGTLCAFRGVRQLLLRRLFLVPSTDDEAAGWASAARFRRDVLAAPWQLAPERERALKKEMDLKALRQRRKAKKRAAVGLHADARVKEERLHEREAEQRRRAEEAEMNRGALV